MTLGDVSHPPVRWSEQDLERFLTIRQEFFLDPMGSNKDRFLEATFVLQRALFDWYLKPHGKFEGMLSLVSSVAEKWSLMRKEERRTLHMRRFALNSATADIPAVESSVSMGQWQKILGSLGLGLSDPGTFDRFLVQLDEETNPSLRVNHRYIGELLPHDNMISYLSSITATFLNENAIIGKVSPCVTHMEQAAVKWLLTLIGWDGGFEVAPSSDTISQNVPIQRLPTAAPPAQRYARWEREEPTGTIVAGGTIANISAFVIARNAVFDYLLGWSGAVQWLGPIAAWEAVRNIWKYERLVVVTSKGAHYSIGKAALQAGVPPGNVLDVVGTKNPWVLDGGALREALTTGLNPGRDLVIAVAAVAGKTETGYVDRMREIGDVLDELAKPPDAKWLPTLKSVVEKLRKPAMGAVIRKEIKAQNNSKKANDAFGAARQELTDKKSDLYKILARQGTRSKGHATIDSSSTSTPPTAVPS